MMVETRKRLRILLSAYACEPNKGSEPAVGWNWAVELCKRGHEVCVLTRQNNREAIELAVIDAPELQKIRFVYFDLGSFLQRWKKIPGGIQLYYLLWQWGVAKLAKRLAQERKFDVVHHVTFVGLRQPSFLGGLGIPFIFGPVAGGERAPMPLRRHFGWRAWFSDLLRDLANLVVHVDPMVRRCLGFASRIFVTSEQTRDLLPKQYLHKTAISLAIGLTQKELDYAAGKVFAQERRLSEKALRVLYMGQFRDLKGMGLGLQAFARLQSVVPDSTLTMVGSGPAEQRWKALAIKENIVNALNWIPWVSKERVLDIYLAHDVLLFPSLRDSGGMVVLEAMACGLPVICLDIGGPAVAVDKSCGFVIPVIDRCEKEVVADLASALITTQPSAVRQHLSAAAMLRAREFTWDRLVPTVYAEVETPGSASSAGGSC